MQRPILKNKPLIEAIFELRWRLQEVTPGIKTDPHYKILIGRMYDRLRSEYPFHQQLPAATAPDEIAAYLVQHRFRKAPDAWPLVQIGPGILTLNDTEGYDWIDFNNRISQVLAALFDSYQDGQSQLEIDSLLLRYIDGIHLDLSKENVLTFLQTNLKTRIQLYDKLFQNTGVADTPSGLDMRLAFNSANPKGVINLRLATGKQRGGSDALVWETVLKSVAEQVPKSRGSILTWVGDAHDLCDDWFFKLIEGELRQRFE